MKIYPFTFEQKLPIPVAEAWDFFSSPLNLARITPPKMNFTVTSSLDADSKIYPGMIITYKVSPLGGVRMNWMTEITHVKEGDYFVDEQRVGPYAIWHHEHHFEPIKGGVLMRDNLHYALPLGILGRIGNALLVEKEVKAIFNFRKKAIDDLFGVYK